MSNDYENNDVECSRLIGKLYIKKYPEEEGDISTYMVTSYSKGCYCLKKDKYDKGTYVSKFFLEKEYKEEGLKYTGYEEEETDGELVEDYLKDLLHFLPCPNRDSINYTFFIRNIVYDIFNFLKRDCNRVEGDKEDLKNSWNYNGERDFRACQYLESIISSDDIDINRTTINILENLKNLYDIDNGEVDMRCYLNNSYEEDEKGDPELIEEDDEEVVDEV